jgi:hypothetical protein
MFVGYVIFGICILSILGATIWLNYNYEKKNYITVSNTYDYEMFSNTSDIKVTVFKDGECVLDMYMSNVCETFKSMGISIKIVPGHEEDEHELCSDELDDTIEVLREHYDIYKVEYL